MPELDVDGARLHWDEAGEGPLVLFLHGALASGRAFRGQLPALRDAFRVVLVDQRGHGRSAPFEGPPPWPGLSVARLAADALALLDALSPDAPAHLVGASMGGLVAARVATDRPDRVASLALLSTPPAPDPTWLAFFARTSPDDLPEGTRRLARHWHGDPYWRDLARGLFAHFADPPPGAFRGRPRPPRALVMQADGDELLSPDDPALWVRRLDAPTRVARVPGDHAFFADGREGTKACNRHLRAFLLGEEPPF